MSTTSISHLVSRHVHEAHANQAKVLLQQGPNGVTLNARWWQRNGAILLCTTYRAVAGLQQSPHLGLLSQHVGVHKAHCCLGCL